MLLVGQSGAGKSTLTAALVAAGFSYLTDEVVSVDPNGLRANPYCRPLELDEAACALLGVRGLGGLGEGQKAQILPSQLGSASKGGQVALVVVLTDDDTSPLRPRFGCVPRRCGDRRASGCCCRCSSRKPSKRRTLSPSSHG